MIERLALARLPGLRQAWDTYVSEWHGCQRCELSKLRSSVCHVRGVLPAKILFVGEAPGDCEDTLGYPFVGPSGKLLDEWIEQCGLAPVPCAFTNTVGCIPFEPGDKVVSPPKKALKVCGDRLTSIIRLACPSHIVFVGKVAANNPSPLPDPESIPDMNVNSPAFRENPPISKWTIHKIPHPAAVLKARGGEQQLLVRRAFNVLERIAEEYVPK